MTYASDKEEIEMKIQATYRDGKDIADSLRDEEEKDWTAAYPEHLLAEREIIDDDAEAEPDETEEERIRREEKNAELALLRAQAVYVRPDVQEWLRDIPSR